MLWAADDPSQVSDSIGWVNYGVLGLLVAAAIAGFIYFKPSVNDIKAERDRALAERDAMAATLRAERDKAVDQRDQMAETFQREWLPMLTRFLAASEAMLPLLQRVVDRDRDRRDRPGGDQ